MNEFTKRRNAAIGAYEDADDEMPRAERADAEHMTDEQRQSITAQMRDAVERLNEATSPEQRAGAVGALEALIAQAGGAGEPEPPAQRYQRMIKYDKRVSRGDDFAGDAWFDIESGEVTYTLVDYDPNAPPAERLLAQFVRALDALPPSIISVWAQRDNDTYRMTWDALSDARELLK